MAQVDFQRAVAQLVMDPEFKRSIVTGEPGVLGGYELTPVEQERVLGIAAQGRGLEVGTLFHRSFRLTKIGYTFPRVVELLGGEALSQILDRYWAEHPDVHEYFFQEARRFGEWLLDHCATEAPDAILEDLAAYELALLEVTIGESEAERTVRFRVEPQELMERLTNRDQPRLTPPGEYWLRLRKTGGEVETAFVATPPSLRK